MKYVLLVYGREADRTEQQHQDCMLKSKVKAVAWKIQGKLLDASPLHPVGTATTLRIRNGERILTDGPFAETTEQLGGYYLIEVDNLDEAIEFASQLPPAEGGSIEIRPVCPLPVSEI